MGVLTGAREEEAFVLRAVYRDRLGVGSYALGGGSWERIAAIPYWRIRPDSRMYYVKTSHEVPGSHRTDILAMPMPPVPLET